MSRESELKFLDVDMDALRPRIKSAGGVFEGRWLETNRVYDDETRSLRARGVLLRLRTCWGTPHGLLTYKEPVDCESRLKVCHEHETQVLNTAATEALLAGLGYVDVLAYQKLRETWRMDRVIVCLDLLPFGSFAEIEGGEEAVFEAAQALGLDPASSSKETYYDINARLRSAAGLPPEESFLFGDAVLASIRTELDPGPANGKGGRERG